MSPVKTSIPSLRHTDHYLTRLPSNLFYPHVFLLSQGFVCGFAVNNYVFKIFITLIF